jgi:hypothetical protein
MILISRAAKSRWVFYCQHIHYFSRWLLLVPHKSTVRHPGSSVHFTDEDTERAKLVNLWEGWWLGRYHANIASILHNSLARWALFSHSIDEDAEELTEATEKETDKCPVGLHDHCILTHCYPQAFPLPLYVPFSFCGSYTNPNTIDKSHRWE